MAIQVGANFFPGACGADRNDEQLIAGGTQLIRADNGPSPLGPTNTPGMYVNKSVHRDSFVIQQIVKQPAPGARSP